MTTRVLTAGDAEDIVALYRGLSDRSRALRFGVPTRGLPEWAIRELTDVEGPSRAGVGVFLDGALVAEGRWVRLIGDVTSAEAAFTVADQHQRKGLGSHLLDVVAELASREGIETLHFSVSGENHGMAALLRRRGIHLSYRGGSGEASLALAPARAVGVGVGGGGTPW